MKDLLFSISLSFLVGIFVGISLTAAAAQDALRRSTIKHHAAHYDSQTGNWEWNQ